MATVSERFDAVVFDMGGVFTVQHPRRLGEIVSGAGVALDLDEAGARRAHYHAVRALTELLEGGDVVEEREQTWEVFDTAYFRSTGLVGADLDAAVAARGESRRGPDPVTGVWTQVLVDNRAAFRRIARDRPVAIVTNNVGTAVEQCHDAELAQVGPGPFTAVEAIVDSAVVGVAKPDPAIFGPALAALGTEPARTLYVGDTVHADVRGARAAGLVPVQLDPFELHADHAHWRVPDLAALAEQLA